MSKNLLISVVIVAIFVAGVYFVLKNTPEKEVMNNQTDEQSMNNNQEENQNEVSNNQSGQNNPGQDAPQMVVLKEGAGEAMTKQGDTLSVLYTGRLTDGTVFDSNVESGQTFEFTLGAGQVISGWDIGLVNMKVGEVRRLTLPPAFAYGSNAIGPIPANSTLVFDVELKAIK